MIFDIIKNYGNNLIGMNIKSQQPDGCADHFLTFNTITKSSDCMNYISITSKFDTNSIDMRINSP